MLEYFVTNLIVYHLFFTAPLFVLLYVPTTCCKRKQTKKHKSRHHKGKGHGKKKHSKTLTPTTPTPVTPMTMTPAPIMFPTAAKVPQTPQSTDLAETGDTKLPIPIASTKSKENVTDKNKTSEKEQEIGELLRCRDYTPDNFVDLKWLFDLLD
ncbi:uncharacterized protein CELE_C47E12.12 [Caenorhabditis elegans]|uniref:Uncharacterized protein n=1 Tax=Caenorhabditis elegans TaxID=6239 RepID=Q7YTQ8_CAEEL|nr:Uncharacterized protein CELE_C47E12.12 [Caenorhabditis elegans]CAE17744.2 Uncharacterized protein CELE_C47E12.12 [Caenorhabditis elegans]|eukprot:NP_001023070.2 Uncharacterized protein CELE_C47E12.12 [Caenorhabditis elegans]